MQNVRSNLTRLKSSIQNKLPEGNDIFGFAGINKESLIRCVDDAYNLSYKLAELEPEFEIIILKRKVSRLLEDCKEYLSKGSDFWGKEKKFDKFVTDLTTIREYIRLTYLVVVDKGLRTEAEAIKILSDYDVLAKAYKDYEDEFNLIEDKLTAVNTAHATVLKLSAAITESNSSASDSVAVITKLKNDSESSFGFISKYEAESKELKEKISDLTNKLTSMESQAKELNSSAEKNKQEYIDLVDTIENQISLNNEQQVEIQNTLDNANRMGMAGSFKSRKDELNFPILIWGGVFVLAVFAIFGIGFHFVAPYVSNREVINYFEVIIKIALVSPFIWLAWMSVKQYGSLSRIREDYAYKYASAMAFEGYKKHAVEIDDDLLKQLLQVSIDNLSQNPIRLFNAKDNHGSPANEMLKDILHTVNGKKNTKNNAKKKETTEDEVE